MSDTQMLPSQPPPRSTSGATGWIYTNLLSTPLNITLTVIGLAIILSLVVPLVQWGLIDADFFGSSQADCSGEGACWVFIGSRWNFFIYGFFPETTYWRVNIVFAMLAILLAPQFFDAFPYKKLFGILTLTAFPLVSAVLLAGGILGLEEVPTEQWSGLILTLVLSFVGIIGSLPIGILLALGRRSKMPIIRGICVIFIEVWRGVPLITVLFMASVMLPLFLPDGVNFDKLLRALIGIVMFQSAYMAEVVRGGLQAIPRGQYEAAAALGLGYWKSMRLIIMPQALKLVIPGIVNTFIALFKDTTLVLIIGLFDLLKTVEVAIADPNWRNVATEGHLFAAFAFWIFCFSMSRYSQSLERKLDTGHKR
jgi:general L-amino acid transport system permease protein